MTIGCFATTAALKVSLTALLLATSAGAANITFNTNAAGTGFGGSSLMLSSSSGQAATLTFIPDSDISTGVPSNVNFGNFTLVCPSCTTQVVGTGSTFSAFTFDLILTDVTDGGTGIFQGTSTGGDLYSDVSQLTINWAPLQLGPGTNNAASGTFGASVFSTTVFTGIVAPNSGAVPGQSTVQGYVDFAAVPEPATFGMVGGAMLLLGFVNRKRILR